MTLLVVHNDNGWVEHLVKRGGKNYFLTFPEHLTSAIDSGGAGGARAPLDFGASEKRTE